MKFSATYDGLVFPVAPLEMVQLIATRCGYVDIDVDPGVNNTSITAKKRGGGTIGVSGSSLEAACDAFCKRCLT